MNNDEILELIKRQKIIVILRGMSDECTAEAAKALAKAGARLMEITFDQKAQNAAEKFASAINAAKNAAGESLVLGAGTVVTARQAQAAYEAGARYIISPNVCPDVIKRTKELGMLSIPGAMTPSEIARAWELGADIVKLFPADFLGAAYVKSVRAPLSHIPLLATGGITLESVPEFLRAGVAGFGVGSPIIKPELVKNGDFDGISALAKAFLQAAQG